MHPEILQLAISECGVFPFEEILNQLSEAQPDSDHQQGLAIEKTLALANNGNIEAAIEMVSSIEKPGPPLRVFCALLHLWNGDHDRFLKEVQASLEKQEPAIPLWKRLGDIGSWLKEDWAADDTLHSWPPQLIEEVYLAALAEFDKEFADRKHTLKERFLKLLNHLLPSKFDFVHPEYDRVRVLRLLARNACDAKHFYSAIRYIEQARIEAKTLLGKRQAEYGYALAEYAHIANFCGIMARDRTASKKAREASIEAKRIAEANPILKPQSYRYCSIIRVFIMVWFESAKAFAIDAPFNTMIERLEELLNDLDVADNYSARLRDAISGDLTIIKNELGNKDEIGDPTTSTKTG